MKQSILQYLINDISYTMLSNATPDNRGDRERVFKDLLHSDVEMSKITKSPKTGAWLVRLKSDSRNFDWDEPFAFKTRSLLDVLQKEAGMIKFAKQIQTKTNVNGLYYIRENHKLVLMIDSMDDLNEDRIDLPNCYLPKDMFKIYTSSKEIKIDHPYVKGTIEIMIREKQEK